MVQSQSEWKSSREAPVHHPRPTELESLGGESGESTFSTSHPGNFYVDGNHHSIDMAPNSM